MVAHDSHVECCLTDLLPQETGLEFVSLAVHLNHPNH